LTSLAFELVTLHYNDGSPMVPGFDQLATPGGSVDLRAQVTIRRIAVRLGLEEDTVSGALRGIPRIDRHVSGARE
jgi:hypothetical protein